MDLATYLSNTKCLSTYKFTVHCIKPENWHGIKIGILVVGFIKATSVAPNLCVVCQHIQLLWYIVLYVVCLYCKC